MVSLSSRFAGAPRRVKGDEAEVEQQRLSDLVEADRYLEGKKAARRPGLGVRVGKLVPPGAEG